MAIKFTAPGKMYSQGNEAGVRSVKFGAMAESAFVPAEVADGAFVVLGGLADSVAYVGTKDYEVNIATAPAAADLPIDEVYLVDISSVSSGVIAGNNYRIGVKLVDLKVAAGYPARVRALMKGDKFWLGEGCFVSAPTAGNYAVLTAGDTRLTPAGAKVAGQFNVRIDLEESFTLGASASGKKYLVEVV